MKRTGFLKRKTKLTVKKLWRPARKALPKSNARQQKARRDRYHEFMRSPEWKAIRRAAIERAGKRCEYTVSVTTPDGYTELIRCPVWHRLTVHHLSYTRFGGREQPEDLQVLCIEHHREVEALNHPTRHTNRRSAA